ncbi:unnamed protein product [Durusdinium trenchii]
MIGLQTYDELSVWVGWTSLEIVFAAFLVLEIILRMHLLGCSTFWCGEDKLWNLFDVLLGITGITDVTVELVNQRRSEIPTSLLRFCRLIRLVRIVKVFRLKFMKDLRLMVKGLVAGLRTLSLAFTLLLAVIYVISGFATYTIGSEDTSSEANPINLQPYFRNLPVSMFTSFRCFTGECTNDLGFPMTSLLADRFGIGFVAAYIASYMLVSLGIFNVILAVYVEITMKAAKETDATTAEQYARESIRVARTTRELLKKFAAAYRIFQELEEQDQVSRIEFRSATAIFTDEDVHDKIAITKELFLLVIQDRDVQRLMDELDLPPDRANLFEVIDADGSGTLHITELVQGLLKIRGEIKKSDAVAALLATKAVQSMVAEIKELYEKNLDVLRSTLQTELSYIRRMNSRAPASAFRVANL